MGADQKVVTDIAEKILEFRHLKKRLVEPSSKKVPGVDTTKDMMEARKQLENHIEQSIPSQFQNLSEDSRENTFYNIAKYSGDVPQSSNVMHFEYFRQYDEVRSRLGNIVFSILPVSPVDKNRRLQNT